MALPVNFKDDVLASSMDGKRRYNMITNSDGTVSFEDVTTYSQEGSNFGSAQINNTNGAINTINNNVLDTIEQISANTSGGKFAGALALKNVNNSLKANSKHFYFDYKNGKYGFNTDPNRGADTFAPFKSGVNPEDIIIADARNLNGATATFSYTLNKGEYIMLYSVMSHPTSGSQAYYSLVPQNDGITCEVIVNNNINIITVENDNTTVSASTSIGGSTSAYIKSIFVAFIPM